MMNQPLRRVDPLGRSAPSTDYIPNDAWLKPPSRGSAWPISTGSMRAIVDSKITEFEEPAVETLQDRIAARHGFEIRAHEHELYGICADCQRKRTKRR